MGAPSYRSRGLVLRKTKLSETDLIITLLSQDGSQIQAVARGARKPRSPFASRLELYSTVDLLLAPGRSLDIVQEAVSVDAHLSLRTDMGRAACAAPPAELLWRTSQQGLAVPRLFDAMVVGYHTMETVPDSTAPAITAAMLLKILAFQGFRPSLTQCPICGSATDRERVRSWFSYNEGGVICDGCRHSAETVLVDTTDVLWADFLLHSTFQVIADNQPGPAPAFAMLRLVQGLMRAHLGLSLKSLEFLFTAGLY